MAEQAQAARGRGRGGAPQGGGAKTLVPWNSRTREITDLLDLDVKIPKPAKAVRLTIVDGEKFVEYDVSAIGAANPEWVKHSVFLQRKVAAQLAEFKEKVLGKPGITQPEREAVTAATNSNAVKAAFTAERWRTLFPNE